MLTRAKVIKRADAGSAVTFEPGRVSTRRGAVVRRAVVEAEQQAQATLVQAGERAQAIVAAAEKEAAALKAAATEVGRAQGYAEVIARAALLGRMEANADERALTKTVALARLLAERLLGKSLSLDDATIVALAQQALNEVKGVRQVRLLAHPDDVVALQAGLVAPQPGFGVFADTALERGDFRIATDVGTIEAHMGERLDLLTAKLLDSLKKGV